MEIDPVPFLANLFLYDYEADFISDLVKNDKSTAIKLKPSYSSMPLASLVIHVIQMILVRFSSLYM